MRQLLASAIVLLAFLLSDPASAQVTGVTTDQAPPIPGAGHDYIHSLNETVNPASGSVSIRIGVPLPIGRSSTLPFAFGYDSNSAHHFNLNAIAADNGGYLAQGGWSYVLPSLSYTLDPVEYLSGGVTGNPTFCPSFYNYVFTDAQGSPHSPGLALIPTGSQQCGGAPTPVLAVEPSGADGVISASTTANTDQQQPPPVIVTDAGGTVYHFSNTATRVHDCPGDNTGINPTPPYNDCFGPTYGTLPDYVEDRNGNKMVFTDNGNGNVQIADDVGRTAISTTGFGVSGNTVSVSGLGQQYTMTWAEQSYDWVATVQQFGPSFAPNFNCNTETSVTFKSSLPELTNIELPNGQSYQFQYETVYGMLSKIIYPTGGYVRYVWGTSSASAASFYSPTPIVSNPGTLPAGWSCESINPSIVVQHRYVSFDGSHEVLQQDFTYSTTFSPVSSPYTTYDFKAWNSKHTVVTTHDLVRGTSYTTTYNYTPSGPTSLVPSAAEQWTGVYNTLAMESNVQTTDFSGNLIRNVNEKYGPVLFPPTDKKTTLENGSTSDLQNTYAGTSLVVLTDTQTFDYGAATTGASTPGAPGSLLKHTHTDYASFATNPVGGTIVDRPSDVITYNGSGTKIAESDYSYDGTSVATISATAHDETNFSASFNVRGNATTVIRKCLQTAPACTSGNPTTTYTYDETGKTLTMKDPNLNTTAYSYLDSYTIGTPPGNTNAYLTKITRPATNGVSHVSNYSYGYLDGQLTVAKDENGQPTTYAYNDSLDRLTGTIYPDGGQTSISYNDTPPTPSVTTTQAMGSSASLTKVATSDGMSHVTTTQITSDPVGTDTTFTIFDGLGKPYQVYNPTRCSPVTTNCGESSWGYTTYTYDPLGRTTLITNPDNSTVQTAYAGRAAEVTDEGNGTRSLQQISQTDALGRLNSVCEVSSTTLSVGTSGTPGACGQDIAGTGFLTSYGYDSLGNLLSVSQGGLNPRSFAYDSLSRLTSSTNPESGQNSFAYDANGNLTSKTAPKPNQTSASVTVATSFQYDSLNRQLTKSYNDGTTPTAHFWYDICPLSGCHGGVTLTNPVGRLVESYTSNTGKFESYDPMGRVKNEWQCTPQNCGSSYFPLAYSYDLIGDLTSSTNGFGVTISNAYNQVGEVVTVTSSLSDTTAHPGTLFEHGGYNAAGQLTGAAIWGGSATPEDHFDHWISELRQYDSRLRLVHVNDKNPAPILTNAYYEILSYAPNGDVLSTDDEVNGSWTFTYDDFNRLASATLATPSAAYTYIYDRYGNRWDQYLGGVCTAGASFCLTFDTSNHVNNGSLTYDAAGNVIGDSQHHYAFDAENRLINVDAGTTATYIYDAQGNRVRKTTPVASLDYLYDLSNRPFTEVTVPASGLGTWDRTEVFAGTRHLATYSGGATGTTYSNFADALGTERYRSTYGGVACEWITSLPFGDGQTTTGTCGDPSPMHFTGKERDLESNLDNFGARYMSSSMGRWVSPDRLNVTDDRLTSPSNTLNKYVYGADNPLRFVDPDGRDIVALYEPPNPLIGSAGHFMLFANNPSTGESAMMSFGELDSSVSGRLLTGTGTSMSSTSTFDWPQTADDLRQNFAALSIQTTPEEAQEVINYIKNFSPSSTDYKLFSQNCTTICRDAMKAIGLIPKNNNQITPSGFWNTVYNLYSKNTFANRFLKGAGLVPQYTGRDYGNPRFGMNTFDFIFLQAKQHCVESWDPKTNTLHGCI